MWPRCCLGVPKRVFAPDERMLIFATDLKTTRLWPSLWMSDRIELGQLHLGLVFFGSHYLKSSHLNKCLKRTTLFSCGNLIIDVFRHVMFWACYAGCSWSLIQDLLLLAGISGFSVLDGSSCGRLNVNTRTWNAFPCDASLPYICKKPMNGSAVALVGMYCMPGLRKYVIYSHWVCPILHFFGVFQQEKTYIAVSFCKASWAFWQSPPLAKCILRCSFPSEYFTVSFYRQGGNESSVSVFRKFKK